MKLYHYYRSSASYRVRIALNIKNIAYESVDIHLVNNEGEHNTPHYLEINPQGLVPCLDVDGHIISQSLAIIEYLDETFPQNPLLPSDPLNKAQVRALALIIACDMHPLNNLRVLSQIKDQFNANEADVITWYHRWLKPGFDAFEAKLKTTERSGPFCFGNQVSLADLCLIPQAFNAHRYNFPMDNYPLINAINDNCLRLDAFSAAKP
jgi:maleylacetoacetate isomerase